MSEFSIDHAYFMSEALQEAKQSLISGDVPIGCVITREHQIIARAHNQVEDLNNPLAHAEIIAIKHATSAIGHKHLLNCTIYVTLEPCSMCSGAIILSRAENLVYGTTDPKTGASGSLYSITNDDRLNHRCNVIAGVMQEECSTLIKDFFRELRKQKNAKSD